MLRALIDFTLSNARRFYSPMGNPLDGKGLTMSKTMSPLYIGETGRRLRERFGEHLRSIRNNSPGFAVAEHFNSASHSLNDIMICGLKRCSGDNTRRKKQEMRLIFELGTLKQNGLNINFSFI